MASCSLGAARGLTHLVGMVTGAHLGGGCGLEASIVLTPVFSWMCQVLTKKEITECLECF